METPNRRGAIITGAASGIGLEVTRRFAALGYEVALLDRTKDSIESAMSSIDSGSALHAVAGDLATTDGALSAIHTALDAVPYASVLIHCAGILRPGKLQELPIDSWDENFAVHVRAPILTSQVFVERTTAAAATSEDPYRIVGVSSIAALHPRAGNGAYSASKAALNVAFKVLAVDIAPLGYTVNIVTPGRTNTPMVSTGLEGRGSSGWKPSALPPLGRYGEPSDVAAAIQFLCSPDAAFITGADIVVDGGSIAAIRPQ
ncbi:SDR family NAD(P)-dependent oxidoreductase [Streptomyces sp. NPDC001393]